MANAVTGFGAQRLSNLVQSDIRRMTRECIRLDGINLGQGICDLPTPPLVKAGAIEAIEQRKSTYSLAEGIPELREGLAKKLERDNDLKVDPQSQIVVSAGTSGGFASTIMALLNPGDGILLFEPYYGYHLNTAILAGMDPQYCTLEPPEFTITREKIINSLEPHTRAIVICTPSNPCGKMLTESELRIIGEVAREKNLLIISDEIYEYFVYDSRQHLSIAALPEYTDRTVTLMGFSKTFSITGWRLGYIVAPPEWAKVITLTNDLLYVCAPTPLQHGVARGLQTEPEYYRQLAHDHLKKRDLICGTLDRVGLTPIVPQGAYYVLADVTCLNKENSFEAAMHILETVKVASVPGRAFYQSPVGESLVRFCYSTEEADLKDACERLSRLKA